MGQRSKPAVCHVMCPSGHVCRQLGSGAMPCQGLYPRVSGVCVESCLHMSCVCMWYIGTRVEAAMCHMCRCMGMMLCEYVMTGIVEIGRNMCIVGVTCGVWCIAVSVSVCCLAGHSCRGICMAEPCVHPHSDPSSPHASHVDVSIMRC